MKSKKICTCGILKQDHFRNDGTNMYRHLYIEQDTELEEWERILLELEREKERVLKKICKLKEDEK